MGLGTDALDDGRDRGDVGIIWSGIGGTEDADWSLAGSGVTRCGYVSVRRDILQKGRREGLRQASSFLWIGEADTPCS